MVTVTVIKTFWDSEEKTCRGPRTKFQATLERAMEISSKLPGYVKFDASADVPEEPKPEEPKADVEPKPEEPKQDLNALKVTELRAIAKERGVKIPAGAKKSDIVKLIEG